MLLLTSIAAIGIYLLVTLPSLALFIMATLPLVIALYWRRAISQYSRFLWRLVIACGLFSTYLASLGPTNLLAPLAQRHPDHIVTKTVLTCVEVVYAPIISRSFKRWLAEVGLLRLYFSYQRDWVQYGTWLFGAFIPNWTCPRA